jgi:Leucine-rich repeat (LRR) protein
MKRIVSIFMMFVMFLSVIPIVTVSVSGVTVSLVNKGISDEQLVEMITYGIIPQNTTYLHLGFNQISDLTPLSGLTNLRRLILFGNQISDISPLEKGATVLGCPIKKR